MFSRNKKPNSTTLLQRNIKNTKSVQVATLSKQRGRGYSKASNMSMAGIYRGKTAVASPTSNLRRVSTLFGRKNTTKVTQQHVSTRSISLSDIKTVTAKKEAPLDLPEITEEQRRGSMFASFRSRVKDECSAPLGINRSSPDSSEESDNLSVDLHSESFDEFDTEEPTTTERKGFSDADLLMFSTLPRSLPKSEESDRIDSKTSKTSTESWKKEDDEI